MNSPQPRTLTEELNSVLRANSLEAPEPGTTIDAVLERVGALPAIAPRRQPRRWLAPTGKWVGAAAIVGLCGAGLVELGRNSDHSKSASSSSAEPAAASPAAGSADSAFGASTGSELKAPNTASTASSGSSEPAFAADCVPSNASTPLGLRAGGTALNVVQSYCAGVRASQVQVTEHENAVSRVVSTLISPQQGLLVQSITVEGSSVRITAVYGIATNAEPPVALPSTPVPGGQPKAQATVQQLTFTTTDGADFKQSAAQTVAQSCDAAQLTLEINPVSTAAALPAVLTVTNTSAAACVISGYPSVAEVPNGGPFSLSQNLSGPAGGVRRQPFEPAPVLAPGARASALLEVRQTRGPWLPGCGAGQAVTVSLPGSGLQTTLPYPVGACDLQVHPFVAGTTGSD